MNALKIYHFDDRYCRKEVSKQNPLNNMMMTEEGFIVPIDYIEDND